MTPLPAQRPARPVSAGGTPCECYPDLDGVLRYAGGDTTPFWAPGAATRHNYLVAVSGWDRWPPSAADIPYAIEWLRRLTPLPPPPLVARRHRPFEAPPWSGIQGRGYPIDLANHLLWLLENP